MLIRLLLCAGIAWAQTTITISHQPLSSFQAVFGGKLSNIAAYSAEVCSAAPANTQIVGGVIRQAAETHGIDVVDMALTAPTSSRAQASSRTAKALSYLKWVSVGESAMAAPVSLIQGSNQSLAKKLTAGGAIAAAVLQAIEVPLNNAQQSGQQAAAAVSGNLLDPARIYPVPAKGCAAGVMFFGEYIKGFAPVTVSLP